MIRRFGFVSAVVLALLPLAARADGVDFTVPDHYVVAAPGSTAVLPPVYRVWERSLNGVRHSIVVSAIRSAADLSKTVDAMVYLLGLRHAIEVSRGDAGLMCGAPSTRVSYAYANQLTYVYRYVIVAGRLLTASYARPVGADADPAAIAALDTLCSGVHQPGTPQGWTIEAPYPRNDSAWRASPGSRSLIAQAVRTAQAGRDAAELYDAEGATVTSDRRESCGAMTIRRVTATLGDGRIQEFASGTIRGYDYVVAYVRPPSAPADPGAMATLTSFCTETAPH